MNQNDRAAATKAAWSKFAQKLKNIRTQMTTIQKSAAESQNRRKLEEVKRKIGNL